MGLQPMGCNPSQGIQGMPQGLSNTFQPVKIAHRRLDVGRVCTLFTARFQQTPLSEACQQIIQQRLLLLAHKESAPKLA